MDIPKKYQQPFKPRNALKNNVNHQIQASEVRVVAMPEGYTDGIYKTNEAQRIADELGMDLIQISPDGNVPVICKITEISKFKYDQKQKNRGNKSKSTEIKEIWLSQNIGDNDLNVKARKAMEFLEKGNKVKVTIKFKGRGIVFKDQGELVMVKFADAVKEFGIPEFMPKMEGKQMHYMLRPVKTTKK